MQLYIVRHGEAENSHAFRDSNRKLTQDGREASLLVGRFAKKLNLCFTHAYASPILRAQQTAQFILLEYPTLQLHTTENLIPDASPNNLFAELQSLTIDSKILLVTHEPFAGNCIANLINTLGHPRVVMKTASMVLLDIAGVPSEGAGRLHWLVTSKMMKLIL